MLRRFTAHPAAVGETYVQHMGRAAAFSGVLFIAAGACLIHALLPWLFQRTASQAITRLHYRMLINRAPSAAAGSARVGDALPE